MSLGTRLDKTFQALNFGPPPPNSGVAYTARPAGGLTSVVGIRTMLNPAAYQLDDAPLYSTPKYGLIQISTPVDFATFAGALRAWLPRGLLAPTNPTSIHLAKFRSAAVVTPSPYVVSTPVAYDHLCSLGERNLAAALDLVHRAPESYLLSLTGTTAAAFDAAKSIQEAVGAAQKQLNQRIVDAHTKPSNAEPELDNSGAGHPRNPHQQAHTTVAGSRTQAEQEVNEANVSTNDEKEQEDTQSPPNVLIEPLDLFEFTGSGVQYDEYDDFGNGIGPIRTTFALSPLQGSRTGNGIEQQQSTLDPRSAPYGDDGTSAVFTQHRREATRKVKTEIKTESHE